MKAEKVVLVDNKVPVSATASSRTVVPRMVAPKAAFLRAASSSRALNKDNRAGLVDKTDSLRSVREHWGRDREQVLVYKNRR